MITTGSRLFLALTRPIRLARWLVSHPLNRAQRLKAIGRFLRWQIATRLLPEASFALPFVNDSVLLVRRGMTGATGNWYSGLDEVHEMGFIVHVLGEQDLFIDVGANIGSYTILAAGGSRCRVLSFEPSPRTFALLKRNIKVNDLEALVDAHCVALSDTPGSIEFTTDRDTTNHVVPAGAAAGVGGSTEVVPVKTLDDLTGRASMSGKIVIKLDVEGYELNVLKGAIRTLQLQNLVAIIVEINGSSSRYASTDDAILDFMSGHGFTAFRYNALTRQIKDSIEGEVATSENLMFTRNLAGVAEAINDRRRVQVRVSSGVA